MKVTMKSTWSGITRTRDIPSLEEVDYQKWLHGGKVIQDALPRLSVDDREFLLTGITPEEWKEMTTSGKADEEDEDD